MSKSFIVIVIILILAIIIVLAMGPERTANEDEDTLVETPTETPSSPPKTSTPRAPSSQTSGLTYEEALVQFAGTRLQFDANCQVSPGRLSLLNGTNIMLDNRSGDARWVSLDGFAYQIPGLGFKIVQAKADSTPYTITIGCGSAVNVGSLLVQ
ncbi:MAG: hypothetical protein ABH833_03945 [Parcubacteria group bacterium]